MTISTAEQSNLKSKAAATSGWTIPKVPITRFSGPYIEAHRPVKYVVSENDSRNKRKDINRRWQKYLPSFGVRK